MEKTAFGYRITFIVLIIMSWVSLACIPFANADQRKVPALVESPISFLSDNLKIAGEYLKNYQQSSEEIDAALHALEGGFVNPGQGGDPVRSPKALPTGKNLYGINPEEVPTKAAWRVGIKLTESLLAKKIGELGRYPKKIGFNLWNTETVRQHGITMSQILYLLGVKPVWTKGNIVRELELIPASELGRPRIDVVVLAAGQYRDIFPCRMELIDLAVVMANNARDDGENFVREGSLNMEQKLKEKGFAPKKARELSTSRIFGGPPGMYGTGLTGAIARSDTWNDKKKLVNLYLSRQGAVYHKGMWGEFYEGLYETGLNDTEVVVHSRSSNLTGGPMQLDHVFEYMGGMVMSIRQITGKDPDAFFADARNPTQAVMMGLKEALMAEARTRYYNPKWIKGNKKHGFSGAAEMARMTGNLFGWQVTKPDVVDDYMWEEAYQIYHNDKYDLELKEWFERENPYAFQDILAIMIEAIRKGYWDASQEIRMELVNTYAMSVAEFGSSGSKRTAANQKLDKYVKALLNAPGNAAGPNVVAQYQASLDKSLKIKEKESRDVVEGFKMAKKKEEARKKKVVTFSFVGGFMVLVVSLLLWQGFRGKSSFWKKVT